MDLSFNLRDLLAQRTFFDVLANMLSEEGPFMARSFKLHNSTLHSVVSTKGIMARSNKSSFVRRDSQIGEHRRDIDVLGGEFPSHIDHTIGTES